jgi:signal transduction histidine kinase
MPQIQFPPYIMILIMSAVITFSLGIYGLKNRKDHTSLYFGISFTLISWWPTLYAIQLLIADHDIQAKIALIVPIGMQFFSIAYMVFIYQLVKNRMPPKWLLVTFSTMCLVVIFSMVTNERFNLMWESTLRLTTPDGFKVVLMIPSTFTKYTLIVFHYAAASINLYLLFSGALHQKQPYRSQFLIVSAATIMSMIISFLYIFGVVSFGFYNPLPAHFVFTGTLVAIAVFKYKMISISPYAKDWVFELINDPVLIIDCNSKLIDYNKASINKLKISQSHIAQDISSIFRDTGIVWDSESKNGHSIAQTRWGTGTNYTFSLLQQELDNSSMQGKLLIFTDISVQKNALQTEHEKEIVTYKESILGDMHDGIGGVVATAVILAQSALDSDDIDEKNTKLVKMTELLESGSFELRSMLNILDKKEIDWTTLIADMRMFSSTVLDAKLIGRTFITDKEPYADVINFDKYLSIFRLFKEIITNIIKHSGASMVHIFISFDDDKLAITVEDNGKGLDKADSKGFGLKNMRRRAEMLNASLEINSKNGTTINIDIPKND